MTTTVVLFDPDHLELSRLPDLRITEQSASIRDTHADTRTEAGRAAGPRCERARSDSPVVANIEPDAKQQAVAL